MAACSYPADPEGGSACTPEEVEENMEQQRTELEMLQNIYSNEVTVVKENTEFLVTVTPQFDGDVQLVLPTSSNLSVPAPTCDMVRAHKRFTKVTHLSPIELYVKYPSGYPSKKSPDFHVSARWLDPKLVPTILENLQKLFTPDCPVVFQCITYLQDELVGDCSSDQAQDVLQPESKMCSSHNQTPDSVDVCDHVSSMPLSEHSDGPSSSLGVRHPCQIFLRSTSQLDDMEEYDQYEVHQEFLQSKHECGICVTELLGKEFCEPCHSCNQLFCKDCVLEYCHTHERSGNETTQTISTSILTSLSGSSGEGQVSHLQCPNQRCTSTLSDALLQSILPKALFERYIHLRNEVQLDSVPGMVFCPRTSCGSRVVSEPDSNLAMCPHCTFPFCKVCKQTWHGPGTCPALEKIGTQLGDEAEADSVVVKIKKQDQRRIEELKSLIWMRSGENARPCPKCQSMIQKSGGCNKMTCRSCESCFCWLCGKHIAGYNHFTDSSCPLFRPEDYLAPQEQGPERGEVEAPNDEQLLQDVLMSECPRCGQVESKTNNRNWIHCRKCHFQFCHLCREACFGAWHFSEYGCKRLTNVKEDLAILRARNEK